MQFSTKSVVLYYYILYKQNNQLNVCHSGINKNVLDCFVLQFKKQAALQYYIAVIF